MTEGETTTLPCPRCGYDIEIEISDPFKEYFCPKCLASIGPAAMAEEKEKEKEEYGWEAELIE
jgi:DNA-directed RNA polymerase subunit RPC12/RpoP